MAKKNDKHSIRKVLANNILMLKYIAKFTPGLIIWSFISAAINGLVSVLNTVYIAKYVLDGLQTNRSFVSMLPFILFVIVLNIALSLLTGLYNGSYLPMKKEYLYGKMHEELFHKAREMELSCYDNPEFYTDFVWAMSEADTKALGVLSSCSIFIQCLTMIGGTFAIIASINPLGLVISALIIIADFFLQKRKNGLNYDLSVIQKPLQRKRDYTSRILYQPEYAKELRLTPVKDVLIDNFSKSNKELMQAIRKYGIKTFFCDVIDDFILYRGMLHGVYIAYLLYQTLVHNIYTYGSLYAVFTATVQFSENCMSFMFIFNKLQNDSLYIERFRHFIEYEPVMKISEEGIKAPLSSEAISIENMYFTYEGCDKPILKDINLTIQPGEKIALVGYNGAGKTTLIKLIMRLYDVSEGCIKLGGRDIREYNLESLRNYFGVVFQDYQLFATTIGENVMMDCVQDSDEKVILDSLEKSGFKEKLDSLELGTKTVVSREFDKNGIQLSGGEAQKLAIARVFPRDCQIVILDEPSSALDPISEYNVNQSMLAAAKDKTVIFISHRLSTTMIADRIIMLENGCIIEQGSHDELMLLNGKYAQMFNMQAEKYKES